MNSSKITISDSEKIGLISNLTTMLSAGISILETIDSLLEDSKGNTRKILEAVRMDLTQGKHLHTSFSEFPLVFDNVTISILKASEEAGTLDVTLKDLRDTTKKEMEFSDKVKGAFIYPVIIVFVFLSVLVMILIVVIPKFETVFSRMKVTLPLPTKVMIFLSHLLLLHTIPTLVVVSIFVGFIYLLYKTKKRAFLGVIFTLPVITKLVKEIDLTRFTRSMALLLSSGIPITTALDLTRNIVLKKELQVTINDCREFVMSGKKLSEGLKLHKKIVPSIMIKIIEAGEKSGSLEKSMQEVSEFLDYQVSKSLTSALTILEPVLMVVVGVMVGGMMLSIIAPIYNLIGQIAGR